MVYDFTSRTHRGGDAQKWELMRAIAPDVGEDIVPLSVADMEFHTAPEISKGLADYVGREILGYPAVSKSYRESVCRWAKERHDVIIRPEDIVSTPGVVSALFTGIEAFTEPGDGVVILTPVYYPFSVAIEETGRTMVRVPLVNEKGRYSIDEKALEESLAREDVKLMIFCNPHNPVGRVWNEEELSFVVEACRRHGVFLISDEIWWDLILPGHHHTSMGRLFTAEDRGFVCTAASKSFNLAGLSTSAILFKNEEVLAAFSRMQEKSHRMNWNLLGYVGTRIAYERALPWLEELLLVLDENRKAACAFFEEHLPEAVVSPLEGTYLLWVDLRAYEKDPLALEKKMLASHLYLDEGYIFGEEGAGFERINLACPKAVLLEALLRLRNALLVEG